MIGWQTKMMKQQTGVGHQIQVRALRPEDSAAILEIGRLSSVAFTTPWVANLEAAGLWAQQPVPGWHRLVAEAGGRVVGLAALGQRQRPRLTHSASVELMVHPDEQPQDVTGPLLDGLLDIADNWLNLQRLELRLLDDASTDLGPYLERGFEPDGKRSRALFVERQPRDVWVLSRLRYLPALDEEPSAEGGKRIERADRPGLLRALIRAPQIEDADDLYDIYRHPQVCRTTLQLPSQEIARVRGRLQEPAEDVYSLVAEVDGVVAGTANLARLTDQRARHVAGLGMSVHPDYWWRGIGSQLLVALIDLADGMLGLSRIELDVNIDNPGGIRLYEKMGFAHEGLRRFHAYGDGRWAHSYFMARLSNDTRTR